MFHQLRNLGLDIIDWSLLLGAIALIALFVALNLIIGLAGTR
jgi:hypothetical protein